MDATRVLLLLLLQALQCCWAEFPASSERTAVEQSAGAVLSKHIDDLYTHGAVIMPGVLSRYVLGPAEEKAGAAAIAARLMDERAVCDATAMNESSICPAPNVKNGAIGIAPCCPLAVSEALLPSAASALLEARAAASHPLAPGDVLAFLGGPMLPRVATSSQTHNDRFWWFVPTGDDDTVADNAFYIDRFFGHAHARPGLGKNDIIDHAADFESESRFAS